MKFEEVITQYEMEQFKSKFITMGQNGECDIIINNNIYQIDINSCHVKSELGAIFNFNSLHKRGTKIEFKTMDATKFTFFIEYQIDRKGDGVLEDSGITTTLSDYYWISIGDDIDFILRTPFLKWIFKYRNELKMNGGTVLPTTSRNWIGHGIYVPVDYIYQLQKMFRDYKQGIGIEELISKLIETPEQHRKKLYNRLKK